MYNPNSSSILAILNAWIFFKYIYLHLQRKLFKSSLTWVLTHQISKIINFKAHYIWSPTKISAEIKYNLRFIVIKLFNLLHCDRYVINPPSFILIQIIPKIFYWQNSFYSKWWKGKIQYPVQLLLHCWVLMKNWDIFFLSQPVAVARPEQTSLAITAIIRTIVYANVFVLAYECLLLSIWIIK